MPLTTLSSNSLDIADKLTVIAVVDSILIAALIIFTLRVEISRAIRFALRYARSATNPFLQMLRERFARSPEERILRTGTRLMKAFNDANEALNAFYAEFRSTEMFHPEWHALNEEQQRAISDYLSRPRRTRSYHDAMQRMYDPPYSEPFKEGTLRENLETMGYRADPDATALNVARRILAEKSRRVDQFHEASQFPDSPLRTDFGVGTEGFARVRQEMDSRIFDGTASFIPEEGGGLRCPRCGSVNCFTDWPAAKHRCKDCHAFGWVQMETFHTTRDEAEFPFPTKEQFGEPVPIIYDKEPVPPQKPLTCPFCQSVGVVWNRKESRLQCMTCDKPYPKPEVPPNRIIKEGQEPG